MLTLNQLRDNKGSKRRSKDLGRGIGSGKGKTSGRGGKGQTARSGVAVKHNEGGQMPLFRRLPKRGFKNYTRVEYDVFNLSCLQRLIDSGSVSPNQSLDQATLKSHGLCTGRKPVKILGTGELKFPVNLIVDGASQSAVKAIEALGGSVSTVKA